MKKNWLLIITSSILYFFIIIIISNYIIIPGINKLRESNNIKQLTYEEKTELIDKVNQKYITLEKDVIEKYAPNIEGINHKYDEIQEGIKESYVKKEKEINNAINDNNVARNKEFYNNGLSKKFYELRDKGMKLEEEKFLLDSKEKKELYTNEVNKNAELKTVENNKANELTRLNENKTNEINSINNQNSNRTSIARKGIFKIILGSILIIMPFLYIILVFNKLTHLSNTVKEKWSQVDVFLKQRADVIPNIVETIKGASNQEKSTLVKVTNARNQFLKATTKEDEILANKNLSKIINSLFILQEDYPELKTNTNFMNLQYNLKEIENNISFSRQEYNKAVLKYKNKLEVFPSNIIASIFNFQPELFFEADDDDKENPNISF